MEINSKEDLYSTLDEIMSRLSVIEQASSDKSKDDNKPKEEDENPKDDGAEVESVDEIEKLLNN